MSTACATTEPTVPPFYPFTGPVTFLDLETVNDRVVEIALWRIVAGEAMAMYTTLVDPGLRVWAPSAKRRAGIERRIHGITADMVRGKPKFIDIAPLIQHLCAGTTVVSHKASFERRMMMIEFERIGMVWNYQHLCTFLLAQKVWPGRQAEGRGYALGVLARDFQVEPVHPHRAAGDAATDMMVLWRLIERAKNQRADVPALIRECTLAAPKAPDEL